MHIWIYVARAKLIIVDGLANVLLSCDNFTKGELRSEQNLMSFSQRT